MSPRGRRRIGPPVGHEELFQLLVEHSTDVVTVVDAQGTITYESPSALRVLGYAPEELVGRNAFERIHEDDRDRLRAVFKAGVLKSVGQQAEYRYRHKDGRWLWMESYGQPLVSNGEVTGGVINTRDITRRKDAEQAFATANAFGQAIADSILAGLIVHDRTGRITYVNRGFCEMTGWSLDDLMGTRPPFAYWPPEAADERMKMFEAIVIRGFDMGQPFEGTLMRKDGTRFDALTLPSPLQLPNGGHTLTAYYDITDRHRLEAEVRQAQKLEAIGRLAGGVAHDFNNLLTAIIGYSEMVLDNLTPSHPLRGDVEEIRRAGESASTLTRQLLAFSRRQKLQPARLDLNVVVTDVKKMLQRVIGEDVQVVVSLAPDLRPMIADRGQIEQVIMNLAVNARDAMPDGGTLLIQTANIAHGAQPHGSFNLPAGEYVALTVSDTGTGMTPEVRSHLFEPFFTTKEQGKGTGLGLATVYGVVQQSGGTIRVDTSPGVGTSFTMFFRTAAEETPEASERSAAALPPARGGRERILLVEDDDRIRALGARALEDWGYSVRVAHDGAEALHVWAREPQPFDLLVTDVVMPVMNGPELAKELLARRPSLKVLFMSGYTGGQFSGIDAPDERVLLLKPFAPVALLRAVAEALGAAV